jgi:hypothetical protein
MDSPFFGNSPLDTAKECFAENNLRFGQGVNDSEKQNLYNGLAHLVIGLERLQIDIGVIKAAIAQIHKQQNS